MVRLKAAMKLVFWRAAMMAMNSASITMVELENPAKAALMSASWGMFQIMGFNHKACGFASVHDFVRAMSQSPQAQLLAFVGFVEQRGLVPFLREHRWGDFARRYNGPGYVYNRYDLKLREAYERWGGRAGTMPLAAG